MTITEFSLQFDILYNNISSNAAPNIDLYEKSFYLTKAQLEIVKEYNGLQNKYQKSFEGSDKRRVDLKELVKDHKSTTSFTNVDNITKNLNSKFFKIPSDVFLIKYEKGKYKKGICESELDIIPVTLDEYNEKVKNPFKRPSKEVAWRLDYSSSTDNVVEIVSSEDITTYHLRYIKYPEPIILTNLLTDPLFIGMNLTIDGVVTPQTCKLNREIHPEILDRAVQLAILDYKENSLENRIQINNKNN